MAQHFNGWNPNTPPAQSTIDKLNRLSQRDWGLEFDPKGDGLPDDAGKDLLFWCKMNCEDFGITPSKARMQDMAEEYAVYSDAQANGGIIVYGKFHGKWSVNPSTRFLVKVLIDMLQSPIKTTQQPGSNVSKQD